MRLLIVQVTGSCDRKHVSRGRTSSSTSCGTVESRNIRKASINIHFYLNVLEVAHSSNCKLDNPEKFKATTKMHEQKLVEAN